MRNNFLNEIVELLLSSISQERGKGLLHSFMFGKPNTPSWQHNLGAEIYYEIDKLTLTALQVRKHGPNHLKALNLDDIKSALQDFVCNNYWYLGDEVFFDQTKGTYAEIISDESKKKFVHALASSSIFQPENSITIFPLVTLNIEVEYYSEPFSLIKPTTKSFSNILPNININFLCPDIFPPLSDWKGEKEIPRSWLAVHSPSIQSSKKMKSAILGALALTPLPQYRHMFSGRNVFGGHCTITDRASMSFGESHTPPMMYEINVSEEDHIWLNIISQKLSSNEKSVLRQIKALEYFYRAWPLEPSERFPILCMALDAMFATGSDITQDVIDGVHEAIGSNIDNSRLRLLMKLRGSVIHGRAPDVYDSKDYEKYYVKYSMDPIQDLELLVAKCLRLNIFGGKLKEHKDPNAKIIAEAKEKGMLPRIINNPTILEKNNIKT